ncbi:MAG: hypothetical protein HC926_02525 [Synechococcaceae cyanobacterium SM2_3_60]|nr:hypothetical protein [Synechococcaceae cyanobacterium SM2_3_60]
MQISNLNGSLRDTPAVAQYYDTTNDWVPGFTEQAERWNGRLAMIGLVASVIMEAVLGHSVFGGLF